MPADLAKTLLENLFLFLLGFAGVTGAIALVMPGWFRTLATQSSKFVDSARFLAFLDKPIEVDHYFLRHPRVLGLAVLAAVGVLVFFYIRL